MFPAKELAIKEASLKIEVVRICQREEKQNDCPRLTPNFPSVKTPARAEALDSKHYANGQQSPTQEGIMSVSQSAHLSPVSFAIFLVLACTVLPTSVPAQQLPKSCAQNDGTWLEKYKECEYASKEWCGTAGGHFDECGSACRHDLNPGPCTMQCVPVCSFATHIIGKDAANSEYVVDGEPVVLKEGRAEEQETPGSATITTTRILDATTTGDLNGDGRDDVVVLLVRNAGGSGSFYYVAAALRTKDGYRGTNAILIGDRIAPQTVETRDGIIIVNYQERYPWQNFAVPPSVSRSRYLVVENDELREKPFAVLDPEVARKLVISEWGPCQPESCSNLTVNVLDGRGGAWYVEAIYDSIVDCSVRARRKIAEALYKSEAWELGRVLLTEQGCRKR